MFYSYHKTGRGWLRFWWVVIWLMAYCPAQAQDNSTFDLDFSTIHVKRLLHKISQFAQKNIVISPQIKGQMALHLQDVTWQQALKAVVASQNLDRKNIQGVIYIRPGHSSGSSSSSVQTHVLNLNYADAQHMAKLLSHQSDHDAKLINVTADERTNSLLVESSADHWQKVKRLVHQLDQPSPQIMVKARVVSIDQTYRRQLGVRFGLKKVKPFKSTHSTGSAKSRGLHVDWPGVSSAASNAGLAMFKVAKDIWIDTELSALATEGHAQIISNPELVASNHQSAEIEAGRKIPFQEKTGEGSTTATFKKAVLKLKVTPQVVHDDQLLLHLTVSQDSQGSERVKGVPTINTRQINTNVLVNNKQTIVLGGIYEKTRQHNTRKVPFLSAVPLVGQLFQFHDNRNRKRQLMIFVTPTLLKS